MGKRKRKRVGPHDVQCTRCGAKPGVYCREPRRILMGYHRERRELVKALNGGLPRLDLTTLIHVDNTIRHESKLASARGRREGWDERKQERVRTLAIVGDIVAEMIGYVVQSQRPLRSR